MPSSGSPPRADGRGGCDATGRGAPLAALVVVAALGFGRTGREQVPGQTALL
ncbi:hypothetical protein [Nocardiopsis flavescens]|uniref:hypothetical protein n=1 Tax=Nocardiopsis flavescens TaxID=758803 RepID=UPI0015BC30E6|nr:hypothetical protein [Nocardiopsis flavescens]